MVVARGLDYPDEAPVTARPQARQAAAVADRLAAITILRHRLRPDKGFNCLVFERTGTDFFAPALGLDADCFSFCKTPLGCFWQSQTGARLDFSIQ